jgi:hemolysin type calcium-binding protein
MAIINIYHGSPDFNPGAVLLDALTGGLDIFHSDPGQMPYEASDGATIDFIGSFTVSGSFPSLAITGPVTGFKVFGSTDTHLPPLMTATGYNFDFGFAEAAVAAYQHGNPGPLNALLNVPTTYNGSPDNDFIVDITSLGSRIYGNAGNDTLLGGSGKDLLWGGPGADHFDFLSVTDSAVGPHRDIIEDFSHAEGDKIVLDLIDADTTKPGDQAFVYIGSDSFAHYHSLHHHVFGMVRFSGGIVQGNVNANLAPDFEIAVKGVTHLSAHDFVL